MILEAGGWECLLHLVLLFQHWHVSAVECWTLPGFARQEKPSVRLHIIESVLYGCSTKVCKTLEVSGCSFLPVRDTTICNLWQKRWEWENVLLCKSGKVFLYFWYWLPIILDQINKPIMRKNNFGWSFGGPEGLLSEYSHSWHNF